MTGGARARVVRVLPEGTIDKEFDYLVPESLGDQVRVGTIVRVELNRRRVRAWVVADDVEPPVGVALRPIARVTGWGPPTDLVDLAAWAARRWAGRRSWFLGTASPEGAVRQLPVPRHQVPAPGSCPALLAAPVPAARAGAAPLGPDPDHGPAAGGELPAAVTGGAGVAAELGRRALTRRRALVRLGPMTDPFAAVAAAAAAGPALVLAPSVGQARRLGNRLRRAGAAVAVMPDDWAAARAGADVVVGTRAGAWAPVADLAVAVVLDEHEEVYQEEQTTTWHARDVVAERARRAGAPCVLVSPVPSLEALAWAGDDGLLRPPRGVERDGWPLVDVVDRRDEDPGRAGLYSPRLVRLLRAEGRVVCVLNRTGRSRLAACASCGALARCERCGASVGQDAAGALACRRCGTVRPVVCPACGATRFKNLRTGVTRAREELEALVREPVAEISGARDADSGAAAGARVVVGTEAALHQVDAADVVAFLDLDQELLAPRYRAAEQALALLVRGARLLARGAYRRDAPAGRAGAGRLVLQTRLPDHEVIQAALHAEPARVATVEWERRRLLRFPPVTALAAVSGPAAGEFIGSLRATLAGGAAPGVEVLGPAGDRWLVRAPDHEVLGAALAAVTRPARGRLRVEVDPARI